MPSARIVNHEPTETFCLPVRPWRPISAKDRAEALAAATVEILRAAALQEMVVAVVVVVVMIAMMMTLVQKVVEKVTTITTIEEIIIKSQRTAEIENGNAI